MGEQFYYPFSLVECFRESITGPKCLKIDPITVCSYKDQPHLRKKLVPYFATESFSHSYITDERESTWIVKFKFLKSHFCCQWHNIVAYVFKGRKSAA